MIHVHFLIPRVDSKDFVGGDEKSTTETRDLGFEQLGQTCWAKTSLLICLKEGKLKQSPNHVGVGWQMAMHWVKLLAPKGL